MGADGTTTAWWRQGDPPRPGLFSSTVDVSGPPPAGTTERVSVASDGTQARGPETEPVSSDAAISGDGRFVAFTSTATNLVAGDTNDVADVFVHDRQTGITERVSVAGDGAQANQGSGWSAISADGRFVAFASTAANLVAGPRSDEQQVFVHDRQTGVTELVSVGTDGAAAGCIDPAITADAGSVAFDAISSRLVPGDTNGDRDVFVRDRRTGTTRRVSVASGGTQGNASSSDPSISAAGRLVAFESDATNLARNGAEGGVFVRDRRSGTTERAPLGSGHPEISADGRYVVFQGGAPGDTTPAIQVMVYDRQAGATDLVSFARDGTPGDEHSLFPAVSAGGRYVTLRSTTSDLVDDDTNGHADVFVRDRSPGPR